jgi:hypothetical protein
MQNLQRWVIGLGLLLSLLSPANAWFGPSAEKPYALAVPPLEAKDALQPTWQWKDAREKIELDNRQTRDGYMFGDTVFKLRPYDYLQAEFVRQVALHEEREALLEKLQNKTLRLLDFEASAGLWLRLSERQGSQWQTVRVRAVVDFDGSRYEAVDNYPFKSSEKPSPVSVPMQDMVKSLVNQFLLF